MIGAVDCRSSQLGSATMPQCLAPLLHNQAVWSPPMFTACVCDLCPVHVLVRLSHPRPLDPGQHGCSVGVLLGPTRVLPMPRQCGGRRAPTRAVLSCVAWCLVVCRPRRVDCLVLTFIGLSHMNIETVTRNESVKFLGHKISFHHQETTEIKNRIRAAWATFRKYHAPGINSNDFLGF